MKKIFVILLLCQWCKAQVYYSNTYNVDNYGAVSVKVIEHNNKFNVMGFGRYLYKNWLPAQTSIVQININDGNDFQIKNIENYPDSSYNNPSFDFIKTNSGFLMATSCADTLNNGGDNRNDFLLTWLDNDLNVVRRKLWGFANKDDFADKIATLPNGDIIFLGRSNVTDTYGQCYLYRLDSLGNIIWLTTFGQIGREEISLDMEIINNTIYISGAFRTFGFPIYLKSFMYKYNLQGVQTGFKEYQNQTNRDFNYPYSLSNDNTNIYLCGATGNNTSTDSVYFNIIKVDTMLNTIWEKELPSLKQNNGFSFASLWDNERKQLMTTAGYYDNTPICGLFAIDTTGNIRWQQEYYTRTDAPQYLYDIQKTSDGGYIMCGNALPNETNPISSFWVIKTDSVGCVVHCITGVDDISPPLEGLGEVKLYPNPAHDFVNIEISPPQERLGVGTNRNLTLYNTEGKAVPANIRWHHAANVSSSQQETHEPKANALGDVWEQSSRGEVNIQHLPRGLYFVKIGNHTATFVKQ